jgi:hypothetical protein
VKARKEPAPFGDAPDIAFVLQAVADQIGHRDHLQTVPLAKLDKLRHARHGAILVHDFADDAGRCKTRQAGQIDRGFSLARPDQHAAFARAQWKHMAGPRQIARAAIRPDGGQNGASAVRGRDAGSGAVARIDRFAECRAEVGSVQRRHQRQPQRVTTLRRKRQADQAAAMRGHEVDNLGRHLFGGDGQVAFVLPIFVVHDYQNAAGANLFDGLGDGNDGHTLYYVPARQAIAALTGAVLKSLRRQDQPWRA